MNVEIGKSTTSLNLIPTTVNGDLKVGVGWENIP